MTTLPSDQCRSQIAARLVPAETAQGWEPTGLFTGVAFRFGALVWVAEPIPPTFFGRGQDRLWPRWVAWVHWTPVDRRSRITLYLFPNPVLVAVSGVLFGVILRLFSEVATREFDPSFATLIIAWCVLVGAIGWVLGRKLSLEQEYRLLRSDTLRALQAH